MHVDDKFVIKFAKDLTLVEDGIYTFFGDNFSFVHHLHRVGFSIFLLHHLPHPTEPTFPDHFFKFKHGLVILFNIFYTCGRLVFCTLIRFSALLPHYYYNYLIIYNSPSISSSSFSNYLSFGQDFKLE